VNDPFEHLDLERELNPANWQEVYQRLHTRGFDAFLFPDGRLTLVFPGNQQHHFDRQGVEALTRFLDQYAGVQPLPTPDESVLKHVRPMRVDSGQAESNEEQSTNDLAALYGPMASHSEYRRGQRVSFFNSESQQILSGTIIWVKAAGPAYENGPVQPVTLVIDTGGLFPIMCYPSDVMRVLS
jgi:hypothetical protein